MVQWKIGLAIKIINFNFSLILNVMISMWNKITNWNLMFHLKFHNHLFYCMKVYFHLFLFCCIFSYLKFCIANNRINGDATLTISKTSYMWKRILLLIILNVWFLINFRCFLFYISNLKFDFQKIRSNYIFDIDLYIAYIYLISLLQTRF